MHIRIKTGQWDGDAGQDRCAKGQELHPVCVPRSALKLWTVVQGGSQATHQGSRIRYARNLRQAWGSRESRMRAVSRFHQLIDRLRQVVSVVHWAVAVSHIQLVGVFQRPAQPGPRHANTAHPITCAGGQHRHGTG